MLLRTKCTCAREGNHLLAELRMLLVFALPIILFVGKKNKSGSIQRNIKQTLSKIHGIFLFHDFTKLFTRVSRRGQCFIVSHLSVISQPFIVCASSINAIMQYYINVLLIKACYILRHKIQHIPVPKYDCCCGHQSNIILH